MESESETKHTDKTFDLNSSKDSVIDEINKIKLEIHDIKSNNNNHKTIILISSFILLCFSLILVLSKIGYSIERLFKLIGIEVSVSSSNFITDIYNITPYLIFFFGSILSVSVFQKIRNADSYKNKIKILEDKKTFLCELISERDTSEINGKSLSQKSNYEEGLKINYFLSVVFKNAKWIITLFVLFLVFYFRPVEREVVKRKIHTEETYGKSYKQTPESQFLNFQKSRMGPSYDVLNVVMNVKKVDGGRVTYSGFYTYKISGTSHEDVSFFTAVFENGQFQGWIPNR